MFALVKQTAYDKIYNTVVKQEDWNKYYFDIDSVNSFPTASGMASSASGLACLAVALNGLFGNVLNEVQLSQLARLGSGSASRSVCGGLVRWRGVSEKMLEQKQVGVGILEKLSKECISRTVVPHSKLEHIKVLILLANNKQKEVSSTSGMQTSVETSELIKYRNSIASRRIDTILQNLRKLEEGLTREQELKLFNNTMENIMKVLVVVSVGQQPIPCHLLGHVSSHLLPQ